MKRIRCPSCGWMYRLPESYLTHELICAKCRSHFHVKHAPGEEGHEGTDVVELPIPTASPFTVALGVTLLLGGLATNPIFSLVGVVILAAGQSGWIGQLLPGRGHRLHALEHAAPVVVPAPGTVEHLHHGMPGYRLRLPVEVHPISAGIKGGILGGILMTVPALTYGVISGHGIWYPINLLSGMVLPTVDEMTVAQLEQYNQSLLVLGTVIHATFSVTIGLIYGVLLPTLPRIPGGQFVWGGVLLPVVWTGLSYGLMGVVNPVLRERVDWLWFIASQFVFGVSAALVVIFSERVPIPPAGPGPGAGHSEGGRAEP